MKPLQEDGRPMAHTRVRAVPGRMLGLFYFISGPLSLHTWVSFLSGTLARLIGCIFRALFRRSHTFLKMNLICSRRIRTLP